VAGDKIVFEDDFRNDVDGEFPSHWNLISGQAVINKIGGQPAFLLTDGNYARVTPLIRSRDYLGNSFTIEYDTYMTEGAYGVICMLRDTGDNELGSIYTSSGSVDYSAVNSQSLSGSYPSGLQYTNYFNKWHHVAIAYKNHQMKAYVDQYRILVVPNVNFVPATMQFAGIGDLNNPIIVKNVRIAQGGDMNMLNSVMTTGRIVTHNITFDINQSVIRPESMGEMNRIYKILNENKDMKFEIQGHTDSDGDDASNLTLSKARADAVKAQFVSMGIADSRLTTKGFGESKPLSPNDTQEGKANNRRVEFVKQ
jgi:outer membrane protein OmpA-like peptidoglycan-associated protein